LSHCHQIEKSGVVDNVVNWAKFKQDEQLKRKGGSKRSKVIGISKLDDANFAGKALSAVPRSQVKEGIGPTLTIWWILMSPCILPQVAPSPRTAH